MNGPYKMNVLLIPAFILMPSPAHAAQVHKQHIPSIRRNRTNTGRHPAHAATRYRQARLLPSPPTAPPPSSILHGSSAAAKPAAPEPHPEEGTRTHRPTSPVPSVSCVAEPSLSTLSLSLSSTPCRRARSRGSPRASARRTSSRASPSGSS